MRFSKRKAFTLTELLVVVIVVGVLAAVAVPKFTRVLETRRTTEAENILAAVRTEQERRCALDKNYLADLSKLTDVLPSSDTKNFSYSVTKTGIEAQSKGKYGYTLKMPSYRDGRVCCDSAEQCAKLNKDYPLCSELIAYADYQSGSECAGEEEPKTCTGSSTQACGCKGMGVQTRTCNTTTGQWSAWGACSISDACECTDPQPASSQTCNICGTQTRTVTCNTATGQWDTSAWGNCSKTEEECSGTKTCDDWSLDQDVDGLCLQAGKIFSMDFLDATLPENASVEEFSATCCASCPEGEYPSNGLCCPEGAVGDQRVVIGDFSRDGVDFGRFQGFLEGHGGKDCR